MQSLCFDTASSLTDRMANGEVKVREVVEAHLAQIERVNPQTNAICTLAGEAALDQAARMDEGFRSDARLGPLYGLPVGIKDLVATRGIRTTQGSPIYRDHVPSHDAAAVKLIREAGAILIGKTNTPEFGAGSQTFNTLFGATRNPFDLSRTCGGSSGGSAVALATGMVALADGTDFGGSLRNPASFCNVVGLRPSPGRVPQWPNADPWNRISVGGPMARTVEDLARLFQVMAQPDDRDPLSVSSAPAPPLGDRPRIAFSPTLGDQFPVEREVLATVESALSDFESAGCDVELADPDLSEAGEVFDVLRAKSYLVAHRNHWANHRASLKDTIVWNIERGLALTSERIAWAESTRWALFSRMRRFLEDYDFLLLPTVQVLPFSVDLPWVDEIEGVAMDSYIDWMKSCSMISVTEHPAISIPAGRSSGGLPVGMQLVGRYRREWSLIQIGRVLELIRAKPFAPPAVASV